MLDYQGLFYPAEWLSLGPFFGSWNSYYIKVEAREGAILFRKSEMIEVWPSCWSSCSVSLERQVGTKYWYYFVPLFGHIAVQKLGGGFQNCLFSPLLGKDSHFDEYFSDGLKPPTRKGWPKTSLKNEVTPGFSVHAQVVRDFFVGNSEIPFLLYFNCQSHWGSCVRMLLMCFLPETLVRFTSKWFAEATVWTSSRRNDGMLCVSSRDHPQFSFAASLLIILRSIFLSQKHWVEKTLTCRFFWYKFVLRKMLRKRCQKFHVQIFFYLR